MTKRIYTEEEKADFESRVEAMTQIQLEKIKTRVREREERRAEEAKLRERAEEAQRIDEAKRTLAKALDVSLAVGIGALLAPIALINGRSKRYKKRKKKRVVVNYFFVLTHKYNN